MPPVPEIGMSEDDDRGARDDFCQESYICAPPVFRRGDKIRAEFLVPAIDRGRKRHKAIAIPLPQFLRARDNKVPLQFRKKQALHFSAGVDYRAIAGNRRGLPVSFDRRAQMQVELRLEEIVIMKYTKPTGGGAIRKSPAQIFEGWHRAAQATETEMGIFFGEAPNTKITSVVVQLDPGKGFYLGKDGGKIFVEKFFPVMGKNPQGNRRLHA